MSPPAPGPPTWGAAGDECRRPARRGGNGRCVSHRGAAVIDARLNNSNATIHGRRSAGQKNAIALPQHAQIVPL
jgi:hypothetical protein